jgi:hypothetical protein
LLMQGCRVLAPLPQDVIALYFRAFGGGSAEGRPVVGDAYYGEGFFFSQRALAAFRACSLRSAGVRFCAAAFPPFLPSAIAAGFFRVIGSFYIIPQR